MYQLRVSIAYYRISNGRNKQCFFPFSIVFPSPPLSFTQSKHWGHRCKLNKAETETESANRAIMQRIAQSEDHRRLLLLLMMKLP